MNLILFDMHDEPPELDDLQYWADELDLTFPVLADTGGDTLRWYDGWGVTAQYAILVDREMRLGTVGDAQLPEAEALLE